MILDHATWRTSLHSWKHDTLKTTMNTSNEELKFGDFHSLENEDLKNHILSVLKSGSERLKLYWVTSTSQTNAVKSTNTTTESENVTVIKKSDDNNKSGGIAVGSSVPHVEKSTEPSTTPKAPVIVSAATCNTPPSSNTPVNKSETPEVVQPANRDEWSFGNNDTVAGPVPPDTTGSGAQVILNNSDAKPQLSFIARDFVPATHKVNPAATEVPQKPHHVPPVSQPEQQPVGPQPSGPHHHVHQTPPPEPKKQPIQHQGPPVPQHPPVPPPHEAPQVPPQVQQQQQPPAPHYAQKQAPPLNKHHLHQHQPHGPLPHHLGGHQHHHHHIENKRNHPPALHQPPPPPHMQHAPLPLPPSTPDQRVQAQAATGAFDSYPPPPPPAAPHVMGADFNTPPVAAVVPLPGQGGAVPPPQPREKSGTVHSWSESDLIRGHVSDGIYSRPGSSTSGPGGPKTYERRNKKKRPADYYQRLESQQNEQQSQAPPNQMQGGGGGGAAFNPRGVTSVSVRQAMEAPSSSNFVGTQGSQQASMMTSQYGQAMQAVAAAATYQMQVNPLIPAAAMQLHLIQQQQQQQQRHQHPATAQQQQQFLAAATQQELSRMALNSAVSAMYPAPHFNQMQPHTPQNPMYHGQTAAVVAASAAATHPNIRPNAPGLTQTSPGRPLPLSPVALTASHAPMNVLGRSPPRNSSAGLPQYSAIDARPMEAQQHHGYHAPPQPAAQASPNVPPMSMPPINAPLNSVSSFPHMSTTNQIHKEVPRTGGQAPTPRMPHIQDGSNITETPPVHQHQQAAISPFITPHLHQQQQQPPLSLPNNNKTVVSTFPIAQQQQQQQQHQRVLPHTPGAGQQVPVSESPRTNVSNAPSHAGQENKKEPMPISVSKSESIASASTETPQIENRAPVVIKPSSTEGQMERKQPGLGLTFQGEDQKDSVQKDAQVEKQNVSDAKTDVISKSAPMSTEAGSGVRIGSKNNVGPPPKLMFGSFNDIESVKDLDKGSPIVNSTADNIKMEQSPMACPTSKPVVSPVVNKSPAVIGEVHQRKEQSAPVAIGPVTGVAPGPATGVAPVVSATPAQPGPAVTENKDTTKPVPTATTTAVPNKEAPAAVVTPQEDKEKPIGVVHPFVSDGGNVNNNKNAEAEAPRPADAAPVANSVSASGPANITTPSTSVPQPAPAPAVNAWGKPPTAVWGKHKSWSEHFSSTATTVVSESPAVPVVNSGSQPPVVTNRKSVEKEGGNKDLKKPVTASEDNRAKALGEFLTGCTVKYSQISLQPRGLYNKSNWCYINATLQALLACPAFYQLLKALPLYKPGARGSSSTPVMDCMVQFVNEFTEMPANQLRYIEKSLGKGPQRSNMDVRSGQPFEPVNVLKMLQVIQYNTSFKHGRQEDAEEFMSCILNALHDEMVACMNACRPDSSPDDKAKENGDVCANSTSGAAVNNEEDDDQWEQVGPKNKSVVTRSAKLSRSPISEAFGGQMRSIFHTQGQKESATLQPFFTLQLEVQNEKVRNVQDALEIHAAKEIIHGYTDATTKQEVEASRRLVIDELPPVLIMHIKCFVYDKTGGAQKIIKQFDYPIDLTISKDLMSQKAKSKFPQSKRNYELVAVVNHHGSRAVGGHYTADVFHSGLQCWIRMDDSNVHVVSLEKVTQFDSNRFPYLLYYRRKDLN